MKKIYELALVGGGITNKNVVTLIDAMNENHQESAILIVTGNFVIPESCIKGYTAEILMDNTKVVATVENNSMLDQEVRVTWTDKDGDKRRTYYSYSRWEELLKKSI